MKDVKKICKIAVIQAAPVMFDKDACTQKAVDLIQEASGGAQLMVFGTVHTRLPLRHDIRVPGGQPQRGGKAGLEVVSG